MYSSALLLGSLLLKACTFIANFISLTTDSESIDSYYVNLFALQSKKNAILPS